MEALYTAEFDSPVGKLQIASTDMGLAHLTLPRANGSGFSGWLQLRARGAQVCEGWAANQRAVRQLLEFLEGKRTEFDLSLDLRATEFQKTVLEEVERVRYGQTASYGEIARRVGRPRAVRAVGAANGANPIPLVIPCHRIIAGDGHLHGYGGGLELKARLLAMESDRTSSGRLL